MSNVGIGLGFMAIGMVLLVLGMPDKSGNPRRFLRFHSAVVLYPPFVLIFLAVGASMLIFSIIGK